MTNSDLKINAILIYGIIILAMCIYPIRTILTSNANLIAIKGNLRSANVYTTTVTGRNGHSSQTSKLIFFINDRKQKYQLAENIGDEYQDAKYQGIRQSLEKADSVSVLIRKSETNKWEPEVFQIKQDNIILIDIDTIKNTDKGILILLLIMGIGCIAFYFYKTSPDKFKKVILGSN